MNATTAKSPPTESKSHQSVTEGLLRTIRQMPIAQQLIPQEANIGWPIPRRKDGRLYIIVPFYSSQNEPTGGAKLFPIFATITVDWKTGAVVEYQRLGYTGTAGVRNAQEPVGRFPHEAVVKMSIAEYRLAKTRLLKMCDQMFDALTAGSNLNPDFLSQFSAGLRQLIEPGLLAQYRALAPAFVNRFVGESTPS